MAAPKRISLVRLTHELPIIDAIEAERRNFQSARNRRILALRYIRQRTADTPRRNRQSASSRPILAKNAGSSFFWPLVSESTKASLPDLKKALVRPSKKSDRPKSNADSNATQKRLAGSRWNLAGASGLNCVSRVSKGRRVLYPALNNRTASTMPEFLSWLSTRSLTKRCGSCWWLGLTQRTKCECEARSVRINSSSCRAYFSATYPARLPPPRAPPVMALMVPTEKSLERIGEVDEDIHTCKSSCKVSVFFFSQPSVRYTTSPAKCVTTNASLCVSRCPLPPAW
mmetsp:Transcript_55367/g.132646  ORF Transcript_55367/g.132646 Transcript_55367/m.132646 type:complete len:285 (-) Transcript_55367:1317-2171(-)